MGRIMKAGGFVDKMKNEQQEGIGPYRVWKPGSQTPGLAMARSIGDSIATGLGVISTPITVSLPVH